MGAANTRATNAPPEAKLDHRREIVRVWELLIYSAAQYPPKPRDNAAISPRRLFRNGTMETAADENASSASVKIRVAHLLFLPRRGATKKVRKKRHLQLRPPKKPPPNNVQREIVFVADPARGPAAIHVGS